MAGYTRQSAASIITGADILAAPLNAEFNQLLAAFDGSSGHNHQGGTGNGPKLDLTAAFTGVLPIANGGTNATTAADARTSLFGVSTTVDNTIARYDGTTGSLQDTGITIDDTDNLVSTGYATIKGTNYTSFSGDPIGTLVGGTTTGTLIEGAANGHLVLALREDSNTDTFSIISGGGNYSIDTTYDKLIAQFGAAGDIILNGTLLSAYGLSLMDDSDASAARTTLGLGTIATQDAAAVSITGGAVSATSGTLSGITLSSSNVTITGGSITNITDLAVADGGTGASTASDARTNLGLGSIATQTSSSVTITGGSITGITDLAIADGGTGASTAANARTNLGLGTIATQAASAVSITGGSITGITDLAIADGGTGASTASGARTNLGLGTAATTASTDYATAAQGTKADSALQSTSTITDGLAGRIQSLANQTYMLGLKMPFAFTITETVTICESGSCTATFKINTTSLGGVANSVSTTEQSQARSSSNTGSAGDDIQVTISSNSSCVGMSFMIKFTRTLS